jgi:hypothetical protein
MARPSTDFALQAATRRASTAVAYITIPARTNVPIKTTIPDTQRTRKKLST